jgi:hypothetical protein
MSSFGTNLKLICGMSKCIAEILDNKNSCNKDILIIEKILNNSKKMASRKQMSSKAIQCNLK